MNRRAFSLVELLIVIGIILTLTAVIWLAVGPAAKKRGYESQVRNDLRQLSIALASYRLDNDDRWAPRIDAIAAYVPGVATSPSFTKEVLPECGAGRAYYRYQRSRDHIDLEKTYVAEYPFDSGSDAVFKADFHCRRTGTLRRVLEPSDDGWVEVAQEEWYVLGSRVDGSVAWFDYFEMWEKEFAYKYDISKLYRD